MDGRGESEPAGPARVDSASDFTSKERQVVQVVEDFEVAVLADDVETICRDLLAVEENRGNDSDNGGHDFCVLDPTNQPDLMLAEGGGDEAYDLPLRRESNNGDQQRRLTRVGHRLLSSYCRNGQILEIMV